MGEGRGGGGWRYGDSHGECALGVILEKRERTKYQNVRTKLRLC